VEIYRNLNFGVKAVHDQLFLRILQYTN